MSLYSSSILRTNLIVLRTYKDKMSADMKEKDVTTYADKLKVINRSSTLSFKELSVVIQNNSEYYMLDNFYKESLNIPRRLKDAKTGEDLIKITDDMIRYHNDAIYSNGYFNDRSIYSFKNETYGFYNNCGNSRIYYSSSDSFIEEFCKKLVVPDKKKRNVNVLVLNCYDGTLAAQFNNIPNARVYGTSPGGYSSVARTKIYSVLNEAINPKIRITNEAFDVLYCQPMISIYEAMKNSKEKIELNNVVKYVRNGGYFITAIPSYRINEDIARFFDKQFSDVWIFTSCSDSYDMCNLVYVVGKKGAPRTDKEIYKKTRVCSRERPDYIFNDKYDDLQFVLPSQEAIIKTFYGSVMGDEEMIEVLKDNPLKDNFVANQITPKIYEQNKRPLLPFNLGHIGLILTSGCLDGIIDEKNGNYHLIKGKVSKKTYTSSEYNDAGTERIESSIINNKTEILMLCADGTFKSLL